MPFVHISFSSLIGKYAFVRSSFFMSLCVPVTQHVHEIHSTFRVLCYVNCDTWTDWNWDWNNDTCWELVFSKVSLVCFIMQQVSRCPPLCVQILLFLSEADIAVLLTWAYSKTLFFLTWNESIHVYMYWSFPTSWCTGRSQQLCWSSLKWKVSSLFSGKG